jgi:hypothetical protein
MTALARHVCAAAHPMPCRLWHFSADWQSHCKNRQSNDQDKATRQRRDHDVEVNTRMMRINADASNGAIRRLSAKHAKERQCKMLALMTREPNWSRHHHVIAFE